MNKDKEIIDCAQLESVVKRIGCLVVAVIIFTIPCLATLAWVLHWDVMLKYLCTIFLIGEIEIINECIYGLVSRLRGEENDKRRKNDE